MTNKPILCLDFDGVIHSYTSGWMGADVIPDPPVPGALDFIIQAVMEFDVHVYSSRSGQEGGIQAMQAWMVDYFTGLLSETYRSRMLASDRAILKVHSTIKWPTEKPPAMVTIDDRAITFTGVWPSIESLKAFQPWNKRDDDEDKRRFDAAARAIWPCIGCDHTYDEALADAEMESSVAYCHDMAESVLKVL